jgi:hypothetical protein
MNIAKASRFIAGLLAASAAAATLTLTSGCFVIALGAAGAVGAGTVAWVEGKLTVGLSGGYDAVVNATDHAIGQLGFAKITSSRDALSAHFYARTSQDTKVHIDVTKVADNLSKVEVRVGTFGDKDASLAIVAKIKANL